MLPFTASLLLRNRRAALRHRRLLIRAPSLIQSPPSHTSAGLCQQRLYSAEGADTSPTHSPPVATAPTSLNAVSQQVRRHLVTHALPTAREGGESELWFTDTLFRLLLQSTNKKSSSASPAALHPLLCVRILEGLGYAVMETPTMPPSSSATAIPTRKGWSHRHAYPSLSVPSALSHVSSAVLRPLLSVLQRSEEKGLAGHRRPHMQVTPVVPFMVEWLCTLPCCETQLPLSQWLPWVVAQYTETRTPVTEGEESPVETEAARNLHTTALPPLEDILPHMVERLRPHLMHNSAFGESTLSQLCEEQLSLLFALCQRAPSPEPVILLSRSTRLAEALWWGGKKAPILELPGVRRALHRVAAAMTDSHASSVDTSAVAARRLQCLLYEVQGRRAAAMGSNTTEAVAAKSDTGEPRATTSSSFTSKHTQSGFTSVLLPFPTSTRSTTAAVGAQLTLRVDDDDVYRRFLLRLTTLQYSIQSRQDAGDRRSPEAPERDDLVQLSLELSASLEGKPVTRSTTVDLTTGDDEDVILRFIQPLHEYMLLLTESDTTFSVATRSQLPVRLSFTAVLAVLRAAFRRLDVLKQQSCCAHAASSGVSEGALDIGSGSQHYTLLPHKARLHTLKTLCELLLRHARSCLAAQEVAASTGPSANSTTSGTPSTWFVEVGPATQEAVLRRLCGAARALVRVVMEERRCSLLEEGPEGAVLSASSITSAQRLRAVRVEGNCRGKEDTGGVSPLASAVSLSATTTTTPALAAGAAFERVLRTLAFRVVEPAIRQLYEACTAAQMSVPLHVVSFSEWMIYLHEVYDAEGIGGTLSEEDLTPPSVLCLGATVMAAARAVLDSVGGSAGLRTARQVLPRPAQQSTSALVEGIRLTALRYFLFDDLHREDLGGAMNGKEDAAAAETEECVWALRHTSAAFFTVWQRTAQCAGSQAGMSETAVVEAVTEAQHRLRTRLGLLTLLLHLRLQLKSLCGDSGASAGVSNRSGDIGGTLPSSLLSLLHCLTEAHTEYAMSSSSPSSNRLLTEPPPDEWSLVLAKNTLQCCVRPPPGVPSGCTSTWELAEELQLLAGDTASGICTWHYVSNPSSLFSLYASARSEDGTLPLLVLLPWSTVVAATEPLRVYDESGLSAKAAETWYTTFAEFLTGYRRGVDSEDGEQRQEQQHPRLTVRLVSIAEEVAFFYPLQHQASVQLHAAVRVVNQEVQEEKELVAPALERVLADARRRREAGTHGSRTVGAVVDEMCGWEVEDDYDGLD